MQSNRRGGDPAVRPNAKLPPNMPALNLAKGLKSGSRHHPTSPSIHEKTEKPEPNFGVSMLSGGDASEIKTADFFSASRSNHDLKDMLKSTNDGKNDDGPDLQMSQTEM